MFWYCSCLMYKEFQGNPVKGSNNKTEGFGGTLALSIENTDEYISFLIRFF